MNAVFEFVQRDLSKRLPVVIDQRTGEGKIRLRGLCTRIECVISAIGVSKVVFRVGNREGTTLFESHRAIRLQRTRALLSTICV